jgi:hypothetical protein
VGIMRIINLYLILTVFCSTIGYSNKFKRIEILKTTVKYDKNFVKSAYSDVAIDSIFYIRSFTVDSIFCKLNNCDTLFRVKYFNMGYRYINNIFCEKDSSILEEGLIYRNKRFDTWTLIDDGCCFEEGTLGVTVNYYYQNFKLGQCDNFSDFKYDLIAGTLSAIINRSYNKNFIDRQLRLICEPDSLNNYNCSISTIDGFSIKTFTLDEIENEIDLVLNGYYDKKIRYRIK